MIRVREFTLSSRSPSNWPSLFRDHSRKRRSHPVKIPFTRPHKVLLIKTLSGRSLLYPRKNVKVKLLEYPKDLLFESFHNPLGNSTNRGSSKSQSTGKCESEVISSLTNKVTRMVEYWGRRRRGPFVYGRHWEIIGRRRLKSPPKGHQRQQTTQVLFSN